MITNIVRDGYRKYGAPSVIVTPTEHCSVWLCVPKNAVEDQIKPIKKVFEDLRRQRGKTHEEVLAYISRKHNVTVESELSKVQDVYFIYINMDKKTSSKERVPYRKQNKRNVGV